MQLGLGGLLMYKPYIVLRESRNVMSKKKTTLLWYWNLCVEKQCIEMSWWTCCVDVEGGGRNKILNG